MLRHESPSRDISREALAKPDTMVINATAVTLEITASQSMRSNRTHSSTLGNEPYFLTVSGLSLV
jgi:hypothetical protein